jgi:hypothetical protein
MNPQEINPAGSLNLQKRRKSLSCLRLRHLPEEALVHLCLLRFSENGTKKVIFKHRNTIRHLK